MSRKHLAATLFTLLAMPAFADRPGKEPIELGNSALESLPKVRFEHKPDRAGHQGHKRGHNFHITVDHFRFAPLKAGQPFVPPESGEMVEGHAHLYEDVFVRGRLVSSRGLARVYGSHHHPGEVLGQMPIPGETRCLRVALYSNDHRPFQLDGEPLKAQHCITGEW